jgi:Mg-chelatase subunit ChlD
VAIYGGAAIANFSDLGTTVNGHVIPATAPETISSTSTTSTGATVYTYNYNFNDGTLDSKHQARRYVEVVLNTGAGGQITKATCNARCPAHTYFIGYASGILGILSDLKVSSSAEATRNPRLIMVVVDRSASMLQPGGGAFGLPQAIVTFLNFFDTSSDYIGIVSFSSNARLEMALTTNFLYAATNNLIDSYELVSNLGVGAAEYGQTIGVPGLDPEMSTANADYDPNYSTNGIRRMKFGGQTAADEGMRMALECLMSNSGFNNPDVVKYIVLFTDGKWNNSRSLLAAPTYTNWVICTNPAPTANDPPAQNVTVVANSNPTLNQNLTNGGSDGVQFMPTLSPMPSYTNALNEITLDVTNVQDHAYDSWVSLDTNVAYEPMASSNGTVNPGGVAGQPMTFVTNTYLGQYGNPSAVTNIYTTTVNVWVQPGSVAYYYPNSTTIPPSSNPTAVFVGDYNNPTNTVTIQMAGNDSIELVSPGYVVDGCFYDGLDLTYEPAPGLQGYRWDNFNTAFEWPDDHTAAPTSSDGSNEPFWYDPAVVRASFMRSLLFRNYANMLTGFYVYRADDPLGSAVEPLTGATRARYGLGAYYPSAGYYWPFDLVGLDWDPTFALTNALSDPDVTITGMSRNLSYSINMLTTNADPEWAGELFYLGTSAGLSSSSAASTVISSAASWKVGAPAWLTTDYSVNMVTDVTSNTTITPNPQVWRPGTFRGTLIGNTNNNSLFSLVTGNASTTGGYVINGTNGDVYANTMSWNGRPTHYFDFSNSTWVTVQSNHNKNIQSLPLGYWKAEEYAWHARATGVTIYSVGYGTLVSDAQQVILAQMANATNTTGYSGTNGGTNIAIPYNAAQPVGAQYYADTTNAISNDFYQIGQAINASLTR